MVKALMYINSSAGGNRWVIYTQPIVACQVDKIFGKVSHRQVAVVRGVIPVSSLTSPPLLLIHSFVV